MSRPSNEVKSGEGRAKKEYVVLSGKGGVGKSSVAVNVSAALALRGKTVGLLDADLHGPSVAKMLGLVGHRAAGAENRIEPAVLLDGRLRVMSVQFLLGKETDSVIWRGPLKHNVIKQFVNDTDWGNPDYLFVDLPPGTGDEPLSVVQTLRNAHGAIVVTTPQSVATFDVKKSIDFCRKVKLPVAGIVENMSGFACPKCGEVTSIFGAGGGREMAESEGLPFLGAIPIDPAMVAAADAADLFVQSHASSPAAKIFQEIVDQLI